MEHNSHQMRMEFEQNVGQSIKGVGHFFIFIVLLVHLKNKPNLPEKTTSAVPFIRVKSYDEEKIEFIQLRCN